MIIIGCDFHTRYLAALLLPAPSEVAEIEKPCVCHPRKSLPPSSLGSINQIAAFERRGKCDNNGNFFYSG